MASEKKKKSRPGKHQRQYYNAKKAREARAKWHETENNVFSNMGTDPNGKPMGSTEGYQSPQSDKVAAPNQRIEKAVPHDREYHPEPELQKKTGRNKKVSTSGASVESVLLKPLSVSVPCSSHGE